MTDRPPMAESVAPVFLTAKQVAELLQVSEKSVLRWAQADVTMPALRVGRTLRFDREMLLLWFRMNTQGFGRSRAQRLTHDEEAQHATA